MSKAQIALLSALALLLAAVISLIAVVATRPAPSAEFVPPPFEEEAQAGIPIGIPVTANYQQLRVNDTFIAGMCGNLAVTDGSADIWLTAPETNAVWIRVLLLDENGRELGSTGLLKAGEYIRRIRLTEQPTETTTVTAKILSYQPETYYSMGSAVAKVQLNVSK